MHHITTHFLFAVSVLTLSSCTVFHPVVNLRKVAWIHGSADCKTNTDPLVQVVQVDRTTWILRQNKCTNYEAPFLFLFLGSQKALLMDTGATEDSRLFPLYTTVDSLIRQYEKRTRNSLDLIVAHTHAHGDHVAGDSQFKKKARTTVVGLKVDDVKSFFNFKNWPLETSTFDLGKRVIELIPIPGHQSASIALYDPQTRLLLPGDSFYPGRLYVQDWQAYRLSMQRLTNFADQHKVSYLVGNHIEMTRTPGQDYPTGTTFQPNEQRLPLTVADLHRLNDALSRMGDTPTYEVHDNFIIYPK